MACTCFSNTQESCDHKRKDNELVIELADDDPATITIDDEELKAWAAEAKATCPRGETCMRGKGAAFAQGQAISRFYEDQYNTARAQDRLWEQLWQLHRTVKLRPHGQRELHDFGDTVPKELRYLVY